ncbi:MAG: 6-carboxytetrahydropterin synthase QueD [Bdellovibrionaceae bacterium]|nr:6-carboxytetrahydropterin synthase QueD [Pseudobdellovibrionaceae bacterium]
MEIFKRFTVEAAHKLTGVPKDHKCSRLHGHSFNIEIHVKGPVSKKEGWVMDFSEIKRAFEPIYDRLDHNYLNEIEGLENPTSENLAIWIWQELKPHLAPLSKVVINETCTSGCSYAGED